MATPVINQPQVAILDTEAVVKRPVVITDEKGNDSIAIRHMTYLCMSWDHRALDGALAAQFLAALRRAAGVAGMTERALGLPPRAGRLRARASRCRSALRERVQAGELPDVMLLLEHPPVYTRGRRSDAGDLPMGEDWYRARRASTSSRPTAAAS